VRRNTSLFDHFVGAGEQGLGRRQAERLCCLQVDGEFVFVRDLHPSNQQVLLPVICDQRSLPRVGIGQQNSARNRLIHQHQHYPRDTVEAFFTSEKVEKVSGVTEAFAGFWLVKTVRCPTGQKIGEAAHGELSSHRIEGSL